MSVDKYASLFLHQMEAIVCLLLKTTDKHFVVGTFKSIHYKCVYSSKLSQKPKWGKTLSFG